jgi:hypothetical protein
MSARNTSRRRRRRARHLLAPIAAAAAAAAALASAPLWAWAAVLPKVIARTDDQVPGSPPGTQFTFFRAPSINTAGVVAFQAQYYQFGLFLGHPSGMFTRIAAGSDPAPGLPPGGTFALFDQNIPINSAGAVAFTSVFNPALPEGSTGAWSSASGTFDAIILPGDPLVGHPAGGTFDSFGTNFNPVVLSDNGTVAYNAWTSTFPNAGRWGIWAGTSRSATAKVALADDPAPTLAPNTFFDGIDAPVINGQGTIAFHATVKGAGTTFYNRDTVWAGTAAGNLRVLARSDDNAPGTTSKFDFSSFGQPDISSTGKIAFKGRLDFSSPFEQGNGIWKHSGASRVDALTLVVRSGSVAPGAGGATFSSFGDPLINAGGAVSFSARLTGDGVTTDNNSGLWIGTDPAHLSLVARTGDQAPGTPLGVKYKWSTDFKHALNDLGQVAFLGQLTGDGVGAANDTGLFVYDPFKGTQLIAREGDTVTVRPGVTKTIAGLELRFGASSGDGRATSLNDNGQVAFGANFADGIYEAVLVADVGGIMPGDANRDGVVDKIDFKILFDHFNQPGAFADGDFTGDGLVNFADYQLLEMNFGKASPSAALSMPDGLILSASVPEPGGFVGVVAALGVLRRRGRRRR